jgi:hypothetical protein
MGGGGGDVEVVEVAEVDVLKSPALYLRSRPKPINHARMVALI